MSLEDELVGEIKNGLTTEEWIAQWTASLPPKDKKTWETWVSDPDKPISVLHRVARRHGLKQAESTFRHWVQEYRGALG